MMCAIYTKVKRDTVLPPCIPQTTRAERASGALTTRSACPMLKRDIRPPRNYTEPQQKRRKGKSAAQKENLRKAREAATAAAHKRAKPPVKQPLRARIALAELRNDVLESENAALRRTVTTLTRVGIENAALRETLTTLSQKCRKEAQRRRRSQKAASRLRHQLAEQSGGMQACWNDLVQVKLELVHAQKEVQALTERLRGDAVKTEEVRVRLKESLKKNRALEKSRKRAKQVLEDAIAPYTQKARAIARLLLRSGTAEKNVGRVMQALGGMMGKKVSRIMSERTASRASLEGGLGGQMQACKEMVEAKDISYSSDGTGHRHVENISRAVSYKVDGVRKIRVLGVHSVTDKSAQTQFNGLVTILDEFAQVWNASPAAQRTQSFFYRDMFAEKLRGTSGDHAKDQKKQHNDLMQAWKHFARDKKLGYEKLASLPLDELSTLMGAVKEEFIEKCGGVGAYMHLSMEDVRKMDAQILEAVVLRLGGQEYASLPTAERRALDLFVWGGCCMHKDLNTIKNGDAAMQKFWVDNRLTGPIALPNKWQRSGTDAGKQSDAATAQSTEMDASLEAIDPAEVYVAPANGSHSGAAHATLLGGKLLADSNDKNGQQKTWDNYLEFNVGKKKARKYPGTSTTRFQSTADASEYIIEFREVLIEFMDVVRNKKEKPGLNNMEQNFENSLTDIPTITEFVVLALISQCFSHPYMLRYIRGPGLLNVNHLDLGPVHDKLIAFIEKVIANPDILLDSPTGEKSTFDGQGFDNPAVIDKIISMIPTLPHLRGALLAFLEGYLVSWRRFAGEFAKGGIIDGLTAAERESAWLAATNDINEGALGWMRVFLRRRPRMTQHQMNARFMYERNETEAWMEKNLSEADERYLRKLARLIQSSRPEARRRDALVAADEADVAVKRAKVAEQERARQEKLDKLYAVVLVFEPEKIRKLNYGQTREQLTVWGKWDAEAVIKGGLSKSGPDAQKERVECLLAAVQRANGKDPRPQRV
ncbi:hypothetical protein MKEN_00187000 [Mycena kentingensis (nom. inval.)]|nr:hypothetical protein MKEN_00187000 [Mycena kentingensis (nom. inval.)]